VNLLDRVGRQVEQYYSRARTVVATERVVIQPLRPDLLPDGRGRRLVYEWRLEWEPSAGPEGEAQVVRQLVSVDGRPPDPDDDPGCIDPRTVSPAPLAAFLPRHRDEYSFTLADTGRTDGRETVALDFRDRQPESPEITWEGECVTIDVPAKTLGRAWVDIETGDVLRLEERFSGTFDFFVPPEHQAHGAPRAMTIQYHETTVRYRPVTFEQPDETVLLPATIETLSIVRNAGSPRVRVTQTLSDYKRFTTGSRVVR
jgi:hypothetical protein